MGTTEAANSQSATQVSTASPVTADQLLGMGEGRRELVRGKVIEMTAPGGEHGRIAMDVAGHLWTFVREQNLGTVYAAETGFLLESDLDTVHAPDVAFVSRARVEQIEETSGYLPGAPDLAVEVVSPNDSYSEVAAKVRDWLAHGSRQVWVVDPRGRVVRVHQQDGAVSELSEGDLIEGGDVLPGLRLPGRDCFPSAT